MERGGAPGSESIRNRETEQSLAVDQSSSLANPTAQHIFNDQGRQKWIFRFVLFYFMFCVCLIVKMKTGEFEKKKRRLEVKQEMKKCVCCVFEIYQCIAC